MDIRMQELLPTLGTISKINPGDKLIVKSKYVGIDQRWFQSMQRFMGGEGREATVNRLTDIYREVQENIYAMLEKIEKHKNENGRNLVDVYRALRMISNTLGKSSKGIQSLMSTYETDSSLTSRLESIRDMFISDVYNEVYLSLPDEYKPDETIGISLQGFVRNSRRLDFTKSIASDSVLQKEKEKEQEKEKENEEQKEEEEEAI